MTQNNNIYSLLLSFSCLNLFNTNKVFSEMTDNSTFPMSDNTPTIAQLYEECSQFHDNIVYDADTNNLYIRCNGNASGFCISLTERGEYLIMLYYVHENIMGSGYYYTKTLSSSNINELLTIIGGQTLYAADQTGNIHTFLQALNNQSN